MEKAIRPQITQMNANGSVAWGKPIGHPQRESAADTKPLFICVYLRSFAAELFFFG